MLYSKLQLFFKTKILYSDQTPLGKKISSNGIRTKWSIFSGIFRPLWTWKRSNLFSGWAKKKIIFSNLFQSSYFGDQSKAWRQSILSFLSLPECCSKSVMGLPSSQVYEAQKLLFAQHHKNWPLGHCLFVLQKTQDRPQHKVKKRILRSTNILHPAHLVLW